ncbi:MAG: phenyltransferase domain-containing protein [Deltaproteobacteria bacterium]|nr:phenyltransferase domain-containing protein [Deltaproteobacteria bacterium]
MHEGIVSPKTRQPLIEVQTVGEYIRRVQRDDGEIPWSDGNMTDPWDHVESAMGLTVAGFHEEAREAYAWSSRNQLPDGSWWAAYWAGEPENGTYKDANMTAYVAVGVLHYFLCTGDHGFLRTMWPCLSRAMEFVIGLQRETGEVRWAKRADGSTARRSLLTGSSSIYMSLTCALKIASLLDEKRPRWEIARLKLGHAIRFRSDLFDRTKERYSMDWYYPVLCGAIQGTAAGERIASGWERYTVEGWGALCVSDKPWVTMAETSELVMALAATGELKTAEALFDWIRDKRYDDGAYWTGVNLPDREIYTQEKTTWTGAAVLLAADMLYGLTPAGPLFSHDFWKPFPFVDAHTGKKLG